MVWKWYSLLGKRRCTRWIRFEWSWSNMERICVIQWTLQLELWSIRRRNFRCNTSRAQNGCSSSDTPWSKQIKGSGLAWPHIIRYRFFLKNLCSKKFFKRWPIHQMRVEYCPGLGMANGKTMMEILLMDALDHHLGLDQLRLNIFF